MLYNRAIFMYEARIFPSTESFFILLTMSDPGTAIAIASLTSVIRYTDIKFNEDNYPDEGKPGSNTNICDASHTDTTLPTIFLTTTSQPPLEHARPVIVPTVTQFLMLYPHVGQSQILVMDNKIMANAARPVSMSLIAEVAPAEEVVSAGAGCCELLGLTKLVEVNLAEDVMLAAVTTVVDVIVPSEDNGGAEVGEANDTVARSIIVGNDWESLPDLHVGSGVSSDKGDAGVGEASDAVARSIIVENDWKRPFQTHTLVQE